MDSTLILCVDDEVPGLELRSTLLAQAGYGVLTATSGEIAIHAFMENQVRCVVLDYLMPEMNGEEVAKAMRAIKPEVPILLLSGCLSLPNSVFKLVDAFLPKGASPDVLLNTVAQMANGEAPTLALSVGSA